ncbi:MAG TPA: peptidoglycan-binding protein LysM [Bacteroidetes bacterium]|nr:peptidoglycan-binding protein LysM [Bacteroidota bacterium]
MGLFSFLKNAGSKIFGSKAEANDESAKIDKIIALKEAVLTLGLNINDFDVDVDGDTVKVKGVVDSQEEREKVILALGNVNGVATVVDEIEVVKPEPEAVFYEVKSGDSLSKIAKAHYGNAMKYNVIFEANKPMLKDPNLIYPGQVLRIPPLPEED